MKAVLIYFNPKDLPEVLQEFNKIKIDKVLFCYYPYPLVIDIARAWVKCHAEYTTIIIVSNDVVVKKENIKRILEKAREYPVITGVMNVENNDYRFFNVCLELPVININYREYKWIEKRNRGIIKVLHSGFAIMCVKRNIILKDGFWEATTQLPMDVNFSQHCYRNYIDIYSDTENIMKHLRHQGEFKIGPEYPPIVKEYLAQ